MISDDKLEGGLGGTILLCVCFLCQCWESVFSPSTVCKFMLVLLINCGLHLCFYILQVLELDFSPVLGLCNVAIIFIVSLGLLATPGFGLLLGC